MSGQSFWSAGWSAGGRRGAGRRRLAAASVIAAAVGACAEGGEASTAAGGGEPGAGGAGGAGGSPAQTSSQGAEATTATAVTSSSAATATATTTTTSDVSTSTTSSGGGGAGGGGAGGGGAGGFASCTGPCLDTTLSVTSDGVEYPFTFAFYGLTSPAKSSSGAWELFIEISRNGSKECPPPSTDPDSVIVLSGVPVFTGPVAVSGPPGVSASMVDYKADILPNQLFDFATQVTITPTAADVCKGCAGQPAPSHPTGFVAFDFSAAWDKAEPPATGAGHVYATHCDSLDDT